jgi:hypothetical protein
MAVLVSSVASTGGACATALSSFQPAHVPPAGHVQAEAGLDVSVSTGGIYKIVDAARELDEAAGARDLTEDEQRTILEGGAQLGLNPPALIPHIGVAYAPREGWEVGARFAASGWRAGVRRQLLAQELAGIDLTVGLGVGRAAFDPPVDSVLKTLRVDDFSRWNVDLPVTLGRHGSWYRWWVGPRLAYSRMSQAMTLNLPREGITVTGTVAGNGYYFGASAGAAFGYRSFFVGPEMTMVWLVGRAVVTAETMMMTSTETVKLDALIVYPGFAVMGEF